jgi:hypothetical protein
MEASWVAVPSHYVLSLCFSECECKNCDAMSFFASSNDSIVLKPTKTKIAGFAIAVDGE